MQENELIKQKDIEKFKTEIKLLKADIISKSSEIKVNEKHEKELEDLLERKRGEHEEARSEILSVIAVKSKLEEQIQNLKNLETQKSSEILRLGKQVNDLSEANETQKKRLMELEVLLWSVRRRREIKMISENVICFLRTKTVQQLKEYVLRQEVALRSQLDKCLQEVKVKEYENTILKKDLLDRQALAQELKAKENENALLRKDLMARQSLAQELKTKENENTTLQLKNKETENAALRKELMVRDTAAKKEVRTEETKKITSRSKRPIEPEASAAKENADEAGFSRQRKGTRKIVAITPGKGLTFTVKETCDEIIKGEVNFTFYPFYPQSVRKIAPVESSQKKPAMIERPSKRRYINVPKEDTDDSAERLFEELSYA
ncbi:hypothetical protein BC829DRAFT_382888 [Chytridium lagenaria]|nr:hypothetical protein BC829DRAFT_382888 [Chytridium lagenaria]